MYIRREVFSLLEDETGEEKYFSTTDITLGDEERLFARRDYEGLSDAQKRVLKRHRSEYAKSLNEQRNKTNVRDIKELLSNNGHDSATTKGTIRGGGVRTTIDVKSVAGPLDNYDTLSKRHIRNVRTEQIKQVKKAGDIMRQKILDGEYNDKVKKSRGGSREVI